MRVCLCVGICAMSLHIDKTGIGLDEHRDTHT